MQKMVVVMCVISLLSCCIQQGERKSEGFTETVSAVGNVIILQENGGRVSQLHSQGLIAFLIKQVMMAIAMCT